MISSEGTLTASLMALAGSEAATMVTRADLQLTASLPAISLIAGPAAGANFANTARPRANQQARYALARSPSTVSTSGYPATGSRREVGRQLSSVIVAIAVTAHRRASWLATGAPR
jgi:hypothetical protein